KSEMEKVAARLGMPYSPQLSPRSYLGVPIFIHNRPIGVMAALNFEREFVYNERDLEVLQTAVGQVAVAMENARLFSEEQRRASYLAFLNNVSKRAISSQDSEEMLSEIVAELQKNFSFDHIGIGLLDYGSKEIEIKAEAGATASALGKRVPLGSGIVGRCARSGEAVLAHAANDGPLMGILPDARSVLCLPLSYGESLLGVLNIESRQEHAFDEQEVLILRTLADLLAAALHNAFVFQKLQQQSITDGLTGIKTRRFFLEAVQGEWKRSSRSGRRFSVVLVDLDKFKNVNDSLGHVEGDLVLARVGRLLEQKCRQSNVVARYGGDEFVILMPETGIDQAESLSERLRLWLATDSMLQERGITGSFGVGSFPVHGATVEEIIRVADAGMYLSKNAGGNCVSTAKPLPGSETRAAQRQMITAYVEGFLQREHTNTNSVEELVATIRKMCGAVQSRQAYMDVVLTLSHASESREVHGEGHGEAVAQYVEPLACALGMAPEDVDELVYAARVHDVGKLVVAEKILGKAGPLTEGEYHIVKKHPVVGSEIVACIPESQSLQEMTRHHHERLDGGGYPDGLRGEAISLGARVLHVVDAYVNMTTDRPFAPARSAHEAMAELERNSGTQFDGLVVRLFLRQLKGEQSMKPV
ncbi:MAG: diguanylate cyclase, partial [Candidatus Korobacteraceae bacterium]